MNMDRRVTARLCAACICLAYLSGCSRSKPPYSPQESLKTFHLPPGFHMELVAAEPEISDAIAMSFDERGRLWVVEMPEYPLNPKPLGRIKVLEDRDGDGYFEHATVFVDGLALSGRRDAVEERHYRYLRARHSVF